MHRRPKGCLIALALVLGALAPPAAVHAAESTETAATTRNRPLPERWEARHLDEPVFGSRMYVVEAGPPDATPVLLVHGLGGSGYQDWWEVIDALESDYRVIAFDLPGFGRSSIPDGELSPPRYARLIAWLTERLELDGVQLVGHSMGGAIALYHASEYPARIDNVVLVDVAGVLHRVAFLRGVAAAQDGNLGLPWFLSRPVGKVLDWGGGMVEEFMVSSEVNVIELLRRSDRTWNALLSNRPRANAAITLLETDFSRTLARFHRPATIIWGGRDGIAPVRTAHLLHGRLPRNRLHIIEGAAHVPMRTHASTFQRLLRGALENPPSGRGTDRPANREPRDFTCRGRRGETISGHFGRIVLDRCPGMRLVDVRADQVRVSSSDDVRLRHVEIDAPGGDAALEVSGSRVLATDARLTGTPAVRVDGSRFDIAGGLLASSEGALAVGRGSRIVASVTRIDSGIRSGFLHGAVEAAHTVVDDAAPLRSAAPAGRTVDGPVLHSHAHLELRPARTAERR